MIFVQDRYPQVPAEFKSNPQLANLSEVKEDKIYMTPEYAKAWSYPRLPKPWRLASGG